MTCQSHWRKRPSIGPLMYCPPGKIDKGRCLRVRLKGFAGSSVGGRQNFDNEVVR